MPTLGMSLPEKVKDPAQERNNLQFWAEIQRLRHQVLTGKTAAPTVNDDVSTGVDVGNLWVDETGDNSYICEDNTRGAAVWAQID